MRREMPDPKIRQTIADITHEVIKDAFGERTWKRCYQYATVGAALATEVTGNEYIVQAGKIDVGHPHEQGYVLDPMYHPAEWHAWFAAPLPKGSMRNHETIDLSARHYRRCIESVGSIWTLDVADFVWGRREDVIAMGVRLDAYQPTIDRLRAQTLDLTHPEAIRMQKLMAAARELLRARI